MSVGGTVDQKRALGDMAATDIVAESTCLHVNSTQHRLNFGTQWFKFKFNDKFNPKGRRA